MRSPKQRKIKRVKTTGKKCKRAPICPLTIYKQKKEAVFHRFFFIGIPFLITNNRKGGFLKAIQNRIEARGKVVFAAVLAKSSLEVRKHICVRF